MGNPIDSAIRQTHQDFGVRHSDETVDDALDKVAAPKIGTTGRMDGAGKVVVHQADRSDEVAQTVLKEPKKTGMQKLIAKVKSFPTPKSFIKSMLKKAAIAGSIGNEESKEIDGYIRQKLIKDLGGKEVDFKTNDGKNIEGMFFESKFSDIAKNPKTILLCTGSHLSYEKYAKPFIEDLTAKGHNVLTFNYEGFGKSEGEISEQGVYNSALAAYDFLVTNEDGKKIPAEGVVLYGHSLGSAAVCEIASKHPKTDVIIDRGYSNLESVIADVLPTGLKTISRVLDASAGMFRNSEKLGEFEGNMFIVQATAKGKEEGDDGTMRSHHAGELQSGAASAQSVDIVKVSSEHENTGASTWAGIMGDNAADKTGRDRLNDFLGGAYTFQEIVAKSKAKDESLKEMKTNINKVKDN